MKLIKVYPYKFHKDLKILGKLSDNLKFIINRNGKCAHCGKVSNSICIFKNSKKQLVILATTPDKDFLTVDHIVPKSDGGANKIRNKQVLCNTCNQKKSNFSMLDFIGIETVKENISYNGRTIWRKSPKINRGEGSFRRLGVAEETCINPHTNKPSIRIGTSYYHIGPRFYASVDT